MTLKFAKVKKKSLQKLAKKQFAKVEKSIKQCLSVYFVSCKVCFKMTAPNPKKKMTHMGN